LRIGIAYSLKPDDGGDEGPDDRYEEFDKPETIEAIADVIRAEGHEVVLLGDGRTLLERVLADPPDFVWNFAEGEGVGRCREARVPAVLEMLGIPYSGSDPLTLAATLDKNVAKRLVGPEAGLDFEVPRGVALAPETSPEDLTRSLAGLASGLRVAALILKPALEGSSKGIRDACLVGTIKEAVAVFERLARDYRQPILVEEFIAGDEVTVGVVGNGAEAEALGAMRVVPKVPTERFVYSLDVKRDWARRVDYEAPARLPGDVLDRLRDAALQIYSALGCRDVARLDFRLRDGLPYFLEANPLPGLAPGTSDLVLLAEGHGIGHAELIRRILHAALDRVGLIPSGPSRR
jgi:D-alanine-D-alanine ligase